MLATSSLHSFFKIRELPFTSISQLLFRFINTGADPGFCKRGFDASAEGWILRGNPGTYALRQITHNHVLYNGLLCGWFCARTYLVAQPCFPLDWKTAERRRKQLFIQEFNRSNLTNRSAQRNSRSYHVISTTPPSPCYSN